MTDTQTLTNLYHRAVMEAVTQTSREHDGGAMDMNAVLGALMMIAGQALGRIGHEPLRNMMLANCMAMLTEIAAEGPGDNRPAVIIADAEGHA